MADVMPPTFQRTAPLYDSAHRRALFMDEAVELVRYRYLLRQLIARNITTRYKRSILGVGWTMLNPLLSMAVLTFVFSNVFVTAVDHYPLYILSGILPWTFFSQVTVAIMTELVWGGSLLNRIYIPRSLFAFSALGTGLVNFALALVPLAIVMAISGVPFTWALLFVPVAIILLSAFALGLGLWLSTLAVQFADVVDMYQILLVAWMYLTPIFYPITIIPEETRWLLYLNPLFYFIEAFREPILYGHLPDPLMAAIAGLCALVALGTGWLYFLRNADDLAYRV